MRLLPSVLSSVLEVAGLVAVVVGAYLFDWRAAVVVAGVVCVVVGLAVDPPRRRP